MNWSIFWFLLFCMMFGILLGERANNADSVVTVLIINSGTIAVIDSERISAGYIPTALRLPKEQPRYPSSADPKAGAINGAKNTTTRHGSAEGV